MIKTDSSGNLQWQRMEPGFSDTIAIFQTKDSGYFLVNHRWCLLKLDSQGNILSNKTLGMMLSGAQQTPNEEYLFVSANGNDAIITKTDRNGDLLWNKTLYSFPNTFSGGVDISNIAAMSDGSYLIAGWATQFSSAIGKDPNLWLLKVDSDGNLLFSKGFSYNANAGIDQNPAVINKIYVTSTKDDGCLLAGTANFPFLIKLASNGDCQWDRSYADGITFRAVLTSATQTSGGDYIVVGGFPNTGSEKALIIQIDSNGNLIWNKTFSSSIRYDAAYSVKVTNDGGYTVLGAQNGNVWLAKFVSPTPPTTPTSTPIIPEFSWLIILPMMIMLFVAIKFRHRKSASLSN